VDSICIGIPLVPNCFIDYRLILAEPHFHGIYRYIKCRQPNARHFRATEPLKYAVAGNANYYINVPPNFSGYPSILKKCKRVTSP
jgi:hypothetical protein